MRILAKFAAVTGIAGLAAGASWSAEIVQPFEPTPLSRVRSLHESSLRTQITLASVKSRRIVRALTK